jgi:TatD DNase family protein
MRVIDSHCHLDDFYKNGELPGVLARAEEAGVRHFVAIGTSSRDADINHELADAQGNIDYTIGIHPLYHGDVIFDFEHYFNLHTKPVAIGEIGLDYHNLPEVSRDAIVAAQRKLFTGQLAIAKKCDCPVIVHSRDAFDDTFNGISEFGIGSDKVLFHCYGYGADEMRMINEFGAYVSFSGTVTYKNAKPLRDALCIANKDKLLIETDCPFLSPVPFRGKPNEPAFLAHTAKFIEDLLANDCAGILDRIFENTVRFFGLNVK